MEGNWELVELLQSSRVWPITNRKHCCLTLWVNVVCLVGLVWFDFCFIWNYFRSTIFLLVLVLNQLFCIFVLCRIFLCFLYVFTAFYVFFFCRMCICAQLVDLCCKSQKRALDPLEPGLRLLWATVWILGTETRFCPRATSALDCWVISPIQFLMFYVNILFLRTVLIYLY